MIRLRRLDRKDAARLCACWAGENALPGYRLPADKAELEALIDEWNRGEVEGRRFEMLLIEKDEAPAGLVSLYEKGEDVSLGISVHPIMQRRGIGTEAVRLAAEHALHEQWFSLLSQCREDNAASIALHEKCGFIKEDVRINRKGNRVICWRLPLRERDKKE